VIKGNLFNPHNDPQRTWSAGYQFRSSYDGRYRIIITSNAYWGLYYYDGTENSLIQSGPSSHINTAAGGYNRLEVIMQSERGYLFINDQFVNALDLSRKVAAGNTWIIGAIFTDEMATGDLYSVNNFTIRAVQTDASSTGANGTIENPNTGNIHTGSFIHLDYLAQGTLWAGDYLVEVNFDNSLASANGSLWDYGISEAPTDLNLPGRKQIHIIVNDTGTWFHKTVTSSSNQSETLDSGQSSAINTGSGESNKLTLLMRGTKGFLYINDVFISELNVSSRTNSNYTWLQAAHWANSNLSGTEFTNHYAHYWSE